MLNSMLAATVDALEAVGLVGAVGYSRNIEVGLSLKRYMRDVSEKFHKKGVEFFTFFCMRERGLPAGAYLQNSINERFPVYKNIESMRNGGAVIIAAGNDAK